MIVAMTFQLKIQFTVILNILFSTLVVFKNFSIEDFLKIILFVFSYMNHFFLSKILFIVTCLKKNTIFYKCKITSLSFNCQLLLSATSSSGFELNCISNTLKTRSKITDVLFSFIQDGLILRNSSLSGTRLYFRFYSSFHL